MDAAPSPRVADDHAAPAEEGGSGGGGCGGSDHGPGGCEADDGLAAPLRRVRLGAAAAPRGEPPTEALLGKQPTA